MGRRIPAGPGSGVVGGERAVQLKCVTGKIDGGFQGQAVGAEDLEAKFSGVALGGDRENHEQESEEQDAEVEKLAHG